MGIATQAAMRQSVLSPATGFPPAVPFLQNFRKGRYRGDNFCLPLSSFAPSDQDGVRTIYRFLEDLFVVLKQPQGKKTRGELAAVRAHLDRQNTDEVFDQVRALGVQSLAADPSELMAKTVHDLRGGAMTALLGQLQLAETRPADEPGLRQLFFLTRDHLKIMRNALLGLDDPKRQADLETRMHSVDLIAEKWQHALVQSAERQTHLEVDCDFHGNIAECCVEFGALDRVLYNLVNNACRHTASGAVRLSIHSHPTGEDHPDDLRFEVCNPVDTADRQRLLDRGDLRTLFQPAVSSTGSGFGMTVALDFVSNAYGLPRRDQALEGRYLGAELTADNDFVVWFHWPVAEGV